MATTIGLPSLTITFQAAAQQAANRSKKGYVGVLYGTPRPRASTSFPARR